jgi:serine/threonine protein kinase
MRCLDAETLSSIALATPDRRNEIDLHIDGCGKCRALVAAFFRASEDSVDSRMPFARTLPSEPPPAANDKCSPGSLMAGRYMLERVVGEGGLSVVWAALDLQTGREVALKVVKTELPELHGRAAREGILSQMLSHPNVVRVHDVIIPAPSAAPVLVMDLLAGEPLDQLLARRRVLSARETLAIMLPLVSAVRAAHARGILHRDLKPSNVFLARESPESAPVTMLLDFGLAKLLATSSEAAMQPLTRSGAVVGTLHYMAPEQLYGSSDVDARADVWAIGAITYECLVGERPVEGKSYGQIVRNMTSGTIRALDPTTHNVPPTLAALVMRMLSHDRDARPSDIGEVHEAFDALARTLSAE